MEIKEVFQEFKKWIWLFVFLSIVGFLAAFLFNFSWRQNFESSSVLVIVPLPNEQKGLSYQANSLSNTQIITDDLTALIQSEEFAQKNGLVNYQLQKIGPSLLRITSSSFGENSAKEKNLLLSEAVKSEVKIFNGSDGFNYSVMEVGSLTGPQTSKFTPKINLVIGFLSGFVLAIIVFGLILYFKDQFHVLLSSSNKKRS